MKKFTKIFAAMLLAALCALCFTACFDSQSGDGDDPNNMSVTFYIGEEVYDEQTGLNYDTGRFTVPEDPSDKDGKQFVGWFTTQEYADTFASRLVSGDKFDGGMSPFDTPLFINDMRGDGEFSDGKFPLYRDTYSGRKFYAAFADVFAYEDNGDGTYTANGTKFVRGMWRFIPTLSLPATHDGKPVTKTGPKFAYSDAETLILNEGLKEIGPMNGSSFEYINIPASVEVIGGSAFMNCSSLTNLTIAKNSQLKRIGYNAFDGCGIKEFSVQDSMQIEVIENRAFAETGITEFTIPATVTEIGKEAFAKVGYLDEKAGKYHPCDFTLASGSSLKKIGEGAFDEGCVSSDFVLPESLYEIGALPKIQGGAVITAGNFNLRQGSCVSNDYVRIKFRSGVSMPRMNIEKGAFSTMSAVDFEYAKGNVGLGTFEKGWDEKVSVIYSVKERVVSGDLEFVIHRGSDPKATVCGFADGMKANVTVPETVNGAPVTAVADYAFSDSEGNYDYQGVIKKVSLPDGITVIGRNAFYARGLTDINFPSSLEEIKTEAFLGSKVSRYPLDIPSLKAVRKDVFSENYTRAIVLSKDLETLESQSSYGEDVYTDASEKPSGWAEDMPFNKVTKIGGIMKSVDMAVYSLYDSDPGSPTATLWYGKYTDPVLEVPQTVSFGGVDYAVKNIAAVAFYRDWHDPEDTAKTSITLPEGVERIGRQAFYRSGLKEIKLPNTLTEIGEEAFGLCEFTEIEIPTGITEITDEIFVNCKNLSDITLAAGHSGLSSFDRFAIDGTKMTEYKGTNGELVYWDDWCLGFVDLPEGNGKVQQVHLYEDLDIRSGTVNIAANAFSMRDGGNGWNNAGVYGYSLGGLSGQHPVVRIPGTVKNIGYTAFRYQFVKEFYIPSSVEKIGAGFFGQGMMSDTATVNCAAASKPDGWHENWLTSDATAVTVNWNASM